MLVLQCWCCYALPHVPLWFKHLSVWQKQNRNCIINKNVHKSSLFYDGINQNKPSSVNCLKDITFSVALSTPSVFIKAIVAGLRTSRYEVCICNLCITGFIFSCGWSHPAADTPLWLLQWHLMKLLECGDTISGVKCYRHKFSCNPCTGLERPLGLPGRWGSQIWRQSAHEGEQVVSPTHQPPLPQGDTCNLLACSSVPQPTVPPPAPQNTHYTIYICQYSLWYEHLWHTEVLHKIWTALQ